MARRTKDIDLVLHIGLHKTASTYVQNVLSARRYDLIKHSLLYPTTGTNAPLAGERTRDGAQSGHALFTSRQLRRGLVPELANEMPPTATTVLLSSEDFSHARVEPEQYSELLGRFASVKVVLVLRRQDVWVESLYKQEVDQYFNFETRSFGEFLAEEGPSLLDFHTRFSPWRDLVGPENFHVLSYDDLPDGTAIARGVLQVAGVDADDLGEFPGVEVPRYESVRAIDTVGLRVLNSYRISSREVRDGLAREIYAAAPAGGPILMTSEMRAGIQARCAEINARIEEEWFDKPVPGFRFGADVATEVSETPSGPAMLDYLDHVLALCESARREEMAAAEAEIAEEAEAEANEATPAVTEAAAAPSASGSKTDAAG